jgi:hypothetical protein
MDPGTKLRFAQDDGAVPSEIIGLSTLVRQRLRQSGRPPEEKYARESVLRSEFFLRRQAKRQALHYFGSAMAQELAAS